MWSRAASRRWSVGPAVAEAGPASRRRTSSPRWLRYSTSITQKRPVPSLAVFSSLTERSRSARCVMMSPGRTGSWKIVVLSLMIASGRPKRFLQVEVHLQWQLLARPTGRPVMRAEPGRQHRRRRDRSVGELGGDVVVPEQRVAVLDRRARSPEVAALHRELARLLVLQLVDQRGDVARQVVGCVMRLGHAITPAPRRRAHVVGGDASCPQQLVGVGDAWRRALRTGPLGARSCRRRSAPTWRNVPWSGCLRFHERAARGELRVVDDLGRSTSTGARTCRRRRAQRPSRRGPA